MGWRLIDTGKSDSYFVTAADEAISIARKENKVENTLHFYRRNSPTISVGRSKKIIDEINLEEYKKNNVKIVRRTSGGGVIYTDEGCLIYCLVISCDKKKLNSNEIFENICGIIIKSLENLNIHSCYKPPNDILLNKKKISGSAILKKENIFLIHGTILLDTDLVLMKKVLRCNTSDKVTTISNELSNPPDFNEIKTQIKKEFEYYFDTGFEESELTKYEEGLIEKLMKQRYLNESWNYAR